MAANTTHSVPILAFLNDEASIKAVEALVEQKNWGKGLVHSGDITDATKYLETEAQPAILIVEIPTAEAAPDLLDNLADVCAPGVKVIVTSTVNEFSFYSWLMEIGIHNYLLQPFTTDTLTTAMEKGGHAQAEPEEQVEGIITAFIGTRGGVGTTTLLSNIAYLMAEHHNEKTAVIDIDPHFGSVAMGFDIHPSNDLSGLLEKPERIDGLFIDRIIEHYTPNLGLLSAEEAFSLHHPVKEEAIEVLFTELRRGYRHIFIDVPRQINAQNEALLSQADKVIMVSEPNLLGLRDMLRMHDYIQGTLNKRAPIALINKQGMAPKLDISPADLSKHYEHEIHSHIPYHLDALTAANDGGVLTETMPKSPIVNALQPICTSLAHSAKIDAEDGKSPGFLGKILKGK